MNEVVLRHRPPVPSEEVRTVVLPGADSELERRSKFSFATMDMLKTDPVTKLLFLQEPQIEKRYTKMLKSARREHVVPRGRAAQERWSLSKACPRCAQRLLQT